MRYEVDLSEASKFARTPAYGIPVIRAAAACGPDGGTLGATNRFLTRDGSPWIPIAGEMHYSRIAADGGASVFATDFDVGAVEQMYRRLRQEPKSITPMVVDIANPSPGIGYMNAERPSFLDRARPDCVLALAVIH